MIALFLAAIPCVLAPADSADLCKDTATESLEKVTVPGVTIGMRGAGTALRRGLCFGHRTRYPPP